MNIIEVEMDCAVMYDLGRHLAQVDREDAYEEWLETAVCARQDRMDGMGVDQLAETLTDLVGGTPEFDALFDTDGNLLPGAERTLRTWVSRDETIRSIRLRLTRSAH
ncbi:hypothetical protein [Paraburkholderia kururiensis]|uniref:hypothetical protein n=1 Tax=Paraburkholderia kururiensis TaxID=984307 RepID=UPI0012E06111|nr:hypothetical protein [Paraburkholderia kururiensis]